MWEEMDTAAKLHKVISGDPKVISAQEAFELATIRRRRGPAPGKGDWLDGSSENAPTW